MKGINKILAEYSNQSLSVITGIPVEHIKMFRKNDIDHYAIRTDSTGRGIPTRGVMEKIIVEKVNDNELVTKRSKNSITPVLST
jgi:hypothetical protein